MPEAPGEIYAQDVRAHGVPRPVRYWSYQSHQTDIVPRKVQLVQLQTLIRRALRLYVDNVRGTARVFSGGLQIVLARRGNGRRHVVCEFAKRPKNDQVICVYVDVPILFFILTRGLAFGLRRGTV